MSIVRSIHKPAVTGRFFTQIDNALLTDTRLSFKARGVLGFILADLASVHFTIESVAKANRVGVRQVAAAFRELEQFGYLEPLPDTLPRDAQGKVRTPARVLHETPLVDAREVWEARLKARDAAALAKPHPGATALAKPQDGTALAKPQDGTALAKPQVKYLELPPDSPEAVMHPPALPEATNKGRKNAASLSASAPPQPRSGDLSSSDLGTPAMDKASADVEAFPPASGASRSSARRVPFIAGAETGRDLPEIDYGPFTDLLAGVVTG